MAEPPRTRGARRQLRPRPLVLAIFVGIALGIIASVLRTEPFGIVVEGGQPAHIMDFASIRGFACAVWRGDLASEGGGSVYTLAASMKATRLWTNLRSRVAMPFAYSPTMLWVLAPFCLLPPRCAFALWSLAGVVGGSWMIARARVHWTALLTLVAPLTFFGLALGQTALLTTTALFFLMGAHAGGGGVARRGPWGEAAVLWLLTAKPPLAVTGGAALLAVGRPRSVALAAGLTLVSTLALTPWLGDGWARDYLRLVGAYDRAGLPAAFAWSIVPQTMSNLRAALHPDLGVGDDVAALVSSAVWIAALGVVVLAGWRRSLPAWLTWSLSVMAFLLFCPHVSSTEDIALFCVLAGVGRAPVPATVQVAAATLAFGGLLLSPGFGPLEAVRPSMLFLAKIGLAALLTTHFFLAAQREPALGHGPAA